MTVNDRWNITKNKGRGLHLRQLCRMLGLSIMYGFENVWIGDIRFRYGEARPHLEGLCQQRGLSVLRD